VAIINRLAADRYWPGASPVGQTIRFFDTTTTTVIGVIEDPTWRAVGEDATPFVFISMDQYPSAAASGFLTLVARIDGPVAPFLPSVRATVRDVEPGLSLALLEPLDNMVGNALMPQRLGGLLLTLFSSLALVLATGGVYGIVGYTVTCQAREIGIRMAMGADRRQIMWSIVRGVTVPVFLGLGSGLVAALLLAGTVSTFMYGVVPRDPLTLVSTLALFSGVAGIAMVLPARRALRLDPITVLNSE
jgi:ABC-type antimicrobial peptide transport system permease subunit